MTLRALITPDSYTVPIEVTISEEEGFTVPITFLEFFQITVSGTLTNGSTVTVQESTNLYKHLRTNSQGEAALYEDSLVTWSDIDSFTDLADKIYTIDQDTLENPKFYRVGIKAGDLQEGDSINIKISNTDSTVTPESIQIISQSSIDVNSDEIVQEAVDQITDGAGPAYDTLIELQNEIQGNDADIVNLLSEIGSFPTELKNLTTGEIGQLENIGTTTINSAQWGYVGGADQPLAQADSPTFADLTLGSDNIKNIIEYVNLTVTASKTLALSDRLTFQIIDSASAITITLPTNISVALPIGTSIEFFRKGAGTVTFATAVGVTLLSQDSLLDIGNTNSAVTLKKINTNEWVLFGDLI